MENTDSWQLRTSSFALPSAAASLTMGEPSTNESAAPKAEQQMAAHMKRGEALPALEVFASAEAVNVRC